MDTRAPQTAKQKVVTLLRVTTALLLIAQFLLGCSRELDGCGGPQLDTGELLGIRESLFSDGGPKAYLVLPNPIEAANVSNITPTDSRLDKLYDGLFLADLLNPSRLETNFLKIRINTLNDSVSMLATPNSGGNYEFPVEDVHYSETMAYHSVSSMIRYVETLGFGLVKSRPLYVMVRAKNDDGSDPTSVNAIYTHNYFNPSLPRTLELYGNTDYAPGMDRDIYWHEFGHYLNESVSREAGIDYAGDSGAVFTEAAALHECLADYLAESVSDKPFIGKWIARNFPSIKTGDPLRSAQANGDDLNDFNGIATYSDDGKNLDRYRMAEWCTRVLWDIRTQFAKEDSKAGALFSDRLVFSAVSLLQRDASLNQFKQALVKADTQLHCGLHGRSIEKAFESRGFSSKVSNLSAPLVLKATPQVFADSTSSSSSNGVTFTFTITNSSGETARNVRIFLETVDGKLVPNTYMQGFGDLPAGASIKVGNGGLSGDYSVYATGAKGSNKYRLRVKTENGPDTVMEGQVQL